MVVLCVCAYWKYITSLTSGWPWGHGAAAATLSRCWIWHGIFSSNKMQQWQCSRDEREECIVLPKFILTLSNNRLFFSLEQLKAYTFSTFPTKAFVNSSFTQFWILEMQFQQRPVKRNLKEMLTFNLKSCLFSFLVYY